MNRTFISMVALMASGALAVGGCATYSGVATPAGGTQYGGASGSPMTGPSGTPGEINPGAPPSGGG
jgi:Ni,Fe-hydrogenase I small subunit